MKMKEIGPKCWGGTRVPPESAMVITWNGSVLQNCILLCKNHCAMYASLFYLYIKDSERRRKFRANLSSTTHQFCATISILTLQTSNCKVRNWGIWFRTIKVTRCTWNNDAFIHADQHQLWHQTEYCDNMVTIKFQTDSIFPQALCVLRNYRHLLKFTKPSKCSQPWLDQSSGTDHTFLVTPLWTSQNGNSHFQNWFVTAQLPVRESVHSVGKSPLILVNGNSPS